jgi:hypothetical protein
MPLVTGIALACEGASTVVALQKVLKFKGVETLKEEYRNEGPGNWTLTGVVFRNVSGNVGEIPFKKKSTTCTNVRPLTQCEVVFEFNPSPLLEELYKETAMAEPGAELITLEN